MGNSAREVSTKKREPGTNPEDLFRLTAGGRESTKHTVKPPFILLSFQIPSPHNALVLTENTVREDNLPPLFLEHALTSLSASNLIFLPTFIHNATQTKLFLNSNALHTITSFVNPRPRIHWPRIKQRPHYVISKAANDLVPTYFTFAHHTQFILTAKV